MNKWINVDHPYDRITLEFAPGTLRKQPDPLPSDQWRALEKAEAALYSTVEGYPRANGWTDVMPNEGDELLNRTWEQATYGIEAIITEESTPEWRTAQIARRVARALAVLSYGEEILLK